MYKFNELNPSSKEAKLLPAAPYVGKVNLSLCSTLVRPHLEYCVYMWSLPHKKHNIVILEQVQRKANKIIEGS